MMRMEELYEMLTIQIMGIQNSIQSGLMNIFLSGKKTEHLKELTRSRRDCFGIH